ncbi:MAG: RNA-binding protein [Bdellovibrionota bacterium]
MAFKLFVRDFNPLTNLNDLENLFSEIGTVKKVVFKERESNGVQRKVAYIEMSSDVEASNCIERIHGMKSDGYTLTVTADKAHVPNPNFSYKQPAYVARPAKSKMQPNKSLPNK